VEAMLGTGGRWRFSFSHSPQLTNQINICRDCVHLINRNQTWLTLSAEISSKRASRESQRDFHFSVLIMWTISRQIWTFCAASNQKEQTIYSIVCGRVRVVKSQRQRGVARHAIGKDFFLAIFSVPP